MAFSACTPLATHDSAVCSIKVDPSRTWVLMLPEPCLHALGTFSTKTARALSPAHSEIIAMLSLFLSCAQATNNAADDIRGNPQTNVANAAMRGPQTFAAIQDFSGPRYPPPGGRGAGGFAGRGRGRGRGRADGDRDQDSSAPQEEGRVPGAEGGELVVAGPKFRLSGIKSSTMPAAPAMQVVMEFLPKKHDGQASVFEATCDFRGMSSDLAAVRFYFLADSPEAAHAFQTLVQTHVNNAASCVLEHIYATTRSGAGGSGTGSGPSSASEAPTQFNPKEFQFMAWRLRDAKDLMHAVHTASYRSACSVAVGGGPCPTFPRSLLSGMRGTLDTTGAGPSSTQVIQQLRDTNLAPLLLEPALRAHQAFLGHDMTFPDQTTVSRVLDVNTDTNVATLSFPGHVAVVLPKGRIEPTEFIKGRVALPPLADPEPRDVFDYLTTSAANTHSTGLMQCLRHIHEVCPWVVTGLLVLLVPSIAKFIVRVEALHMQYAEKKLAADAEKFASEAASGAEAEAGAGAGFGVDEEMGTGTGTGGGSMFDVRGPKRWDVLDGVDEEGKEEEEEKEEGEEHGFDSSAHRHHKAHRGPGAGVDAASAPRVLPSLTTVLEAVVRNLGSSDKDATRFCIPCGVPNILTSCFLTRTMDVSQLVEQLSAARARSDKRIFHMHAQGSGARADQGSSVSGEAAASSPHHHADVGGAGSAGAGRGGRSTYGLPSDVNFVDSFMRVLHTARERARMEIPAPMSTNPDFDDPENVIQRANLLSPALFPTMVALHSGQVETTTTSRHNFERLYEVVAVAMAAVGATPRIMHACASICVESEAMSLDALMSAIALSDFQREDPRKHTSPPLDALCNLGHCSARIRSGVNAATFRLCFEGRMEEAAAVNRKFVMSRVAEIAEVFRSGKAHPTFQGMYASLVNKWKAAAIRRKRLGLKTMSVFQEATFGRLANSTFRSNTSNLGAFLVRAMAELDYRGGMVHDQANCFFIWVFMSTVMDTSPYSITPVILNCGPPGLGKSFCANIAYSMLPECLTKKINHMSSTALTAMSTTMATSFEDDAPKEAFGMENGVISKMGANMKAIVTDRQLSYMVNKGFDPNTGRRENIEDTFAIHLARCVSTNSAQQDPAMKDRTVFINSADGQKRPDKHPDSTTDILSTTEQWQQCREYFSTLTEMQGMMYCGVRGGLPPFNIDAANILMNKMGERAKAYGLRFDARTFKRCMQVAVNLCALNACLNVTSWQAGDLAMQDEFDLQAFLPAVGPMQTVTNEHVRIAFAMMMIHTADNSMKEFMSIVTKVLTRSETGTPTTAVDMVAIHPEHRKPMPGYVMVQLPNAGRHQNIRDYLKDIYSREFHRTDKFMNVYNSLLTDTVSNSINTEHLTWETAAWPPGMKPVLPRGQAPTNANCAAVALAKHNLISRDKVAATAVALQASYANFCPKKVGGSGATAAGVAAGAAAPPPEHHHHHTGAAGGGGSIPGQGPEGVGSPSFVTSGGFTPDSNPTPGWCIADPATKTVELSQPTNLPGKKIITVLAVHVSCFDTPVSGWQLLEKIILETRDQHELEDITNVPGKLVQTMFVPIGKPAQPHVPQCCEIVGNPEAEPVVLQPPPGVTDVVMQNISNVTKFATEMQCAANTGAVDDLHLAPTATFTTKLVALIGNPEDLKAPVVLPVATSQAAMWCHFMQWGMCALQDNDGTGVPDEKPVFKLGPHTLTATQTLRLDHYLTTKVSSHEPVIDMRTYGKPLPKRLEPKPKNMFDMRKVPQKLTEPTFSFASRAPAIATPTGTPSHSLAHPPTPMSKHGHGHGHGPAAGQAPQSSPCPSQAGSISGPHVPQSPCAFAAQPPVASKTMEAPFQKPAPLRRRIDDEGFVSLQVISSSKQRTETPSRVMPMGTMGAMAKPKTSNKRGRTVYEEEEVEEEEEEPGPPDEEEEGQPQSVFGVPGSS